MKTGVWKSLVKKREKPRLLPAGRLTFTEEESTQVQNDWKSTKKGIAPEKGLFNDVF